MLHKSHVQGIKRVYLVYKKITALKSPFNRPLWISYIGFNNGVIFKAL